MSHVFNILVTCVFCNLGKNTSYWCDFKSRDQKMFFFLLSLRCEAEPWEGHSADLATVLQ